MVRVSLVVPVRNAAQTLPACLAALERLDPGPVEVILVDNGSSDGSRALLENFARARAARRTRLVDEPRRGAAAARNTGVRAATGEVVAFTDADCAPDPAWLRHLTPAFGDPAVGAVAGRVTAAPPATLVERLSALYTLRLPSGPARHTRWTPGEGGYPTANLAVRQALLAELDGFDERVGIYGEDYDLCARLYARSATIAYVPDARVVHHHRTTLGGLLRQAFGFGRSHPYLLRRHAGKGLWVDLPRRSVAWPGCPVPAWIDLAAADKKVLGIALLGTAYPPALWLLPLYALWLAGIVAGRARESGSPASPPVALALAGLMLLKAGAMTAGRWWGSMRYGTLCF